MARFNFKEYIPLYSELLNEIYELSLHYFRLGFGFYLGFSFLNFGAFIDWLLVITFMDYIFIKIIDEILHHMLPQSMHGLLSNNIIAQCISMGIISLILQQSLLLLGISRLLYLAFCFYSLLFSKLLVESIAISFYLKSSWYVLPVAINILISLLYLTDRYLDMNVMNYLLDLPIIQGIFAELGIQTDIFLNYQIKMSPQESQYYHLVLKDNQLLNDFRKHFLNSCSRVSLKEKLADFKQKLADIYQLYPAVYEDHPGRFISLPLDWEQLRLILECYPKEVHEDILKQYYHHKPHTLWRSLLANNPWLSNDRDSIKNHDSFQQSHYQEILLYLWLRSQKINRETDFIEHMSKLYRKRNYCINPHRMFDEKMNNDKGDMPDSIEHFQYHILHQLEHCIHYQFLTETKIKQIWNQAITDYWKNLLKSISIHEFFELKELWKKVLSGAKDIKNNAFKVFDLDLEFKYQFIKTMKNKYENQWQSQHTEFIEQLFYINHGYSGHVEKFFLVFSKLMKKYANEDLSVLIKHYSEVTQTDFLFKK
jgi:acyl-CoA-binding protein